MGLARLSAAHTAASAAPQIKPARWWGTTARSTGRACTAAAPVSLIPAAAPAEVRTEVATVSTCEMLTEILAKLPTDQRPVWSLVRDSASNLMHFHLNEAGR